MKTVKNLKDSIAGQLTGMNLNNVTNLYGALERAARIVIQRTHALEATDRQQITLFSNVFDYSPSSTIFGGNFIDLRPIGISRNYLDENYKMYIAEFDKTKLVTPTGYDITFEFDKGTPIMRVSQDVARDAILIDPMQSTSGWTLGGTGTGFALDQTVFYESPASLRFNVATGTATLSRTISPTIDMSEYAGVGSVFLAVNTPSTANITSITLKIGSSASNYYSVTQTLPMLGSWKASQFQLVQFDLSTASTVGAPNSSKIAYVEIDVVASGTLTNFYVGRLFAALPSPHLLIFNTAAIFLRGGTLNQSITDDTDQIVLADPAYLLLEKQGAYEVGFQQGGTLSGRVLTTLENDLNGPHGLYERFLADNPSQTRTTTTNWYD